MKSKTVLIIGSNSDIARETDKIIKRNFNVINLNSKNFDLSKRSSSENIDLDFDHLIFFSAINQKKHLAIIPIRDEDENSWLLDPFMGSTLIDATLKNLITTKFFRADQSRNSETGGHGLGLAIVDKLLSKNGHSLEFSSTLGEGSSFKINIRLS